MARKRQTTKQYGPKDIVRPFYKGTWQGMYTYWRNPALWSDQMVYKTLREVGGKPYTARDVRYIIKAYCKIMKQYFKKTEKF
jgi:hypothetical protein